MVKRLTRRRRLSQGTSGQIIELLRREALTIDQIAGAIGVTRTAVRAQLASLQQHGDVEQRGTRRSLSKPARIFGVTAEAELLLSRAYIPILTQLLHVLTNSMPRRKFDLIMREVGRGLMIGRAKPTGTLRERVLAASALINDLGGTTEIEEESNRYLIRGHGCPLAAATAKYPEACNAIESLLREFLGHSVAKCCERYERRRCCFEVAKRSAPSAAG
jgi:predicted ArsR family transcriptional regulator